MEVKFDAVNVDTSLAQEYLKDNKELSELYEDFNGTIKKYSPYVFDGKVFEKQSTTYIFDGNQFDKKSSNQGDISQNVQNKDPLVKLQDLASALKRNAALIAQLEYHIRNIPIEDTTVQLNLIVRNLKCQLTKERIKDYSSHLRLFSDDPLLAFGSLVDMLWYSRRSLALVSVSRATAAICHLFVKLFYEAGFDSLILVFQHDLFEEVPQHWTKKRQIRGLGSGTVAVVSEHTDVDSAVDTLLSVSMQAPWRVRRILVQENVYQHFKETLRWKCNLKKSSGETLPTDVQCFESLTYDTKTFLIDPMETVPEQPSEVTVEAYRTTKEMLSMLQKDETRYLSLWMNDIALINEVTHTTTAPLTWVNNLADFRGPPQVSEAVFSHVFDTEIRIKKCSKIRKLCELLESWLKLNLDSRRDILCDVLDKYVALDSKNKIFTDIKKSLWNCTMKSFVDVGKDYVCVGISKSVGIKGLSTSEFFFTVENFESLLQGNGIAVYTIGGVSAIQPELGIIENADVPVVNVGRFVEGDFIISSGLSPDTRVIWTNSGTIFAN